MYEQVSETISINLAAVNVNKWFKRLFGLWKAHVPIYSIYYSVITVWHEFPSVKLELYFFVVRKHFST